MKKRIRSWQNMKLQTKILSVCFVTFCISFGITLYLSSQINHILGELDDTYTSNRQLMETQNILQNIQDDVTEYLNTKSTDSLTRYYDHENELNELLEGFCTEICSDEDRIMEKNIFYMSQSYLEIANEAIQAKRGRNIEEYQRAYEDLTIQYKYLSTAVYNLNNRQFEENSQTYENMLLSTRLTSFQNTILIVCVGILNMILMLVLTGHMVSPLKKLAGAAKEVGEGNLDIQLSETTNRDEVGIVIRAFNQMVNSLKEYILRQQVSMQRENAMKEKAILAEAHLKDAQLKYLRAQINPHFLFNTLNAGAQLAMMEEADDTYRYLHTVAGFYRYAAEQDSGLTTLQKEIELIDNYMYIMNVRYSGEIHYEKQVDSQVLDCRMPGMILQPIVENCVKHGVGELQREKKITLEVSFEHNQVVVSVRDNGVGMAQEVIDHLLNEEQEEIHESREGGIGMHNVIARLRMYYDKKDIMEITSTGENMGTEVTLYLPAEGEENDV